MEPKSSVKSEHFKAKILAENSRGSKFDPRSLAIWSPLYGDLVVVTSWLELARIVMMHLPGMQFRPNSVMLLIQGVKGRSRDFRNVKN